MAISAGTRTNHFHRSIVKRLLSEKIIGVNAAQSHDSMYAMAIGPAGDMSRRP